ncbi:MAG: bacteriohemerythrin [Planctomycetota bacterium]|jgi:hemerythrin-like metal-binding protein
MIEWNDKYSVGISMIDEEHKKLIGILNKAIFAKGHNDNPEELREVLREMTNYALTHFKTEETYMKEFNYPEYQDHKEEHRDFSAGIIAYHEKLIKGNYQIANEIIEYLKWWFVNHIQVTDKKYIYCFKRNGFK